MLNLRVAARGDTAGEAVAALLDGHLAQFLLGHLPSSDVVGGGNSHGQADREEDECEDLHLEGSGLLRLVSILDMWLSHWMGINLLSWVLCNSDDVLVDVCFSFLRSRKYGLYSSGASGYA